MKKVTLKNFQGIHQLAKLSMETYGKPPTISKGLAVSLLKSVHISSLPKLGCEMFVKGTDFGELWIQNLAGVYHVEVYAGKELSL